MISCISEFGFHTEVTERTEKAARNSLWGTRGAQGLRERIFRECVFLDPEFPVIPVEISSSALRLS
jgi:hypothetical protein